MLTDRIVEVTVPVIQLAMNERENRRQEETSNQTVELLCIFIQKIKLH
jgi:hypothetical protein